MCEFGDPKNHGILQKIIAFMEGDDFTAPLHQTCGLRVVLKDLRAEKIQVERGDWGRKGVEMQAVR
jgi:hypothetical protein